MPEGKVSETLWPKTNGLHCPSVYDLLHTVELGYFTASPSSTGNNTEIDLKLS